MPSKKAIKARARSRVPRRAVRLTSRELEVLNLVGAGMTNKEIGAALSISQGTVKIHVHNILSKLAVNSRVGAIAKATAGHML
jgi:DNA-binding NarL/FixJ family response regulator